ncbi:MAG: cobalamin B12-binding domain-containing protein [Brooklawnia sp.]|jgi:5-methyltetrahydrofolate--homocysteine methyltransferase
MSAELLKKLAESLMEYDPDETVALVNQALAEGIEARTILDEGLIKGMDEVGLLFKEGELFVPEVSLAAECLSEALVILKPELKKNVTAGPVVKVVIGTVEGDVHDIGKNLVATMFEGAGWEVTDLGANVSADKFIDEAKSQGADVIACSALLTTTMPAMVEVAQAAKVQGIRDQVKILFGGAPVFEKWAIDNGADGYAEDAASAVAVVRQLIAA